jgi:anti-sigma factor RsiW
MSDCESAEMRDLLPDVVAGRLSDVEAARVRRHIDGCSACEAELSLLRAVRAARPRPVSIDVAKIVAQLPRPSVPVSGETDPNVVSLESRRVASRPATSQTAWRTRSVWRMAATIGVIIAGGWSVVLLKSGGVAPMMAGSSDSARLVAAAESLGTVVSSVAAAVDSPAATTPATTAAASSTAGAVVSFGDVGDYTDEELQRVLDRLDRWDGATSTETVTTAPILPIPAGGSLQ